MSRMHFNPAAVAELAEYHAEWQGCARRMARALCVDGGPALDELPELAKALADAIGRDPLAARLSHVLSVLGLTKPTFYRLVKMADET